MDDKDNVWYLCLYHINFGLMSQFSSISLFPNISITKGSKCYSCVQSNQPLVRKPTEK